MEIEEKYLPIGTVVQLKGGTKRAMIIGYCPVIETGESFDYSACVFPEGVMSSRDGLLFNHGEIEKISHMGLSDEEEKMFVGKVKEVMEKIESEEN